MVRGLGPGLPRPRADAGRRGLRQAAARPDAAASATCTRTARSRPTSGTSATSTRRCTPGPTHLHLPHREGARGARATSTSSKRAFQKLLLNFTWWVNRKDRDGQATSSRAASSGSTTSASSTAARRCPPAATSSRPTAPPGWRSSARTCSRSRVELAARRPALRGHGREVRRALPLDRVGDGPRRATTGDVGRGGRLLLRRAAAARRQRRAAQGALDGRAAAAVRGHRRSRASSERTRARGSSDGLRASRAACPSCCDSIHAAGTGHGRRRPRHRSRS